MLGRLTFALAVLAAPTMVAANTITTFSGPMLYCGISFAIDLAAGDKIEVEHGPDFMLEGLIGPSGGFGLYEGQFPQDGTGDKKVEAGLDKPTYLIKRGADFSYVIWTGDKPAPYFIHVWGMAFKGTPADYRLLRRLQFGSTARRACPQPSFEQKK